MRKNRRGNNSQSLYHLSKETPPLSPKILQFPKGWPPGDPARWAPVAIRDWARRLLNDQYDRATCTLAIPERTRAAIYRYCELHHPASTANQPAPPTSPPTRPKPSQSTTQAKQGGGNRPLSSDNTPSFTESIAAWYKSARCTLRFKGGVSGEVHLDATLPNLRILLDAEPKTDLSGLRSIAIDRRKQLDPEKVERHFAAGGQSAEAAYYASVLRELYGEIVGLRDVRVDGKPTGEINRKRINALGFPAGPTPQETRNAVVTWGRFHMGTWGRSDSARAALGSAMAAYVGDTVEPNRELRNLRTERGSQPSVRLSPTHETDSAERARRWEMAERVEACAIYSRGEIPSWMRSYSPLDDLPFLRGMTGLEQATFANKFPSPGLIAFIAASTDAAIQERERAEVRKHTSNDRTPPWYAPDGHKVTSNIAARDSDGSAQPGGRQAPTHAVAGTSRTGENDAEMAEIDRGSSSSGSSREGTSNQDRPERFQTSPVTASNLPSLETPNRARCDRSVTQIQQTNSFALLGAKDDEEDDRNDEAGLFDSDEETTRIFLQQPGARATVRTMQPTFPPAPEFRPPNMAADPADST